MRKYKRLRIGEWELGNLAGQPCAVTYQDGRRRRFRIGPEGLSQAEAEAALVVFVRQHARTVSAGTEPTCQTIYEAFVKDRELDNRRTTDHGFAWKALAPLFGTLPPSAIDKAACRAYEARRIEQGCRPGTVWSELTLFRAMLNWAEHATMIDRAPKVWLPPKPEPRDWNIPEADLHKLMDAAAPHVRLFIVLAITTAGRMAAILDLTWARVDFERGLITLDNPDRERTHKGRATVPMNATARAALCEAKAAALTDHVIEWNGARVANIKKGLAAAATKAGIKCSAHALRHTAGRMMAEAGVPMEEIASYMGHTSPAVTRRVYAKFSPDYLRKAAGALELQRIRRVG